MENLGWVLFALLLGWVAGLFTVHQLQRRQRKKAHDAAKAVVSGIVKGLENIAEITITEVERDELPPEVKAAIEEIEKQQKSKPH